MKETALLTRSNMIKGTDLANELLQKIIGMTPTRAKLGHGSFITIDFGRDITEQVKTRSGMKTRSYGEWRLWIYMCAWRIDMNKSPLIGSNDPREKIEKHVIELEKRTLTGIQILNDAFDAKFQFGTEIDLYLFSTNTDQYEQWMLYMPNEMVFTAGPSNIWAHKKSSE
jgi:hypothetical protein